MNNNSKSKVVSVRFSPDEESLYLRAVEEENMTSLSEWVRYCCRLRVEELQKRDGYWTTKGERKELNNHEQDGYKALDKSGLA